MYVNSSGDAFLVVVLVLLGTLLENRVSDDIQRYIKGLGVD